MRRKLGLRKKRTRVKERARSKPDRHKKQESRTYRKKGKMWIKKNRFD